MENSIEDIAKVDPRNEITGIKNELMTMKVSQDKIAALDEIINKIDKDITAAEALDEARMIRHNAIEAN